MPHHETHRHDPGGDHDWSQMLADLDRSAALWAEVDAAAVRWVGVQPGQSVADVGCGTGRSVVPLARAVGESGRVLALDAEPACLEAATRRVRDAGVAGTVRLARHELPAPLPEDGLDLVWASHVVHHLPDQEQGIRQLLRSLAPDGRLALVEGGLPMRCLPLDLGVGEPGLEDRLLAVEAAWFARMRASIPGAVRTPCGWNVLLRRTGLTDVRSATFLLDLPAPLHPPVITDVVDGLAARVHRAEEDLTPDDRDAWAALLDPDGGGWLGRREDVGLLAAMTVHVASRLPDD